MDVAEIEITEDMIMTGEDERQVDLILRRWLGERCDPHAVVARFNSAI